MQIFDLAQTGNPGILLASSILLGLAIGLTTYLIGTRVHPGAASAHIGDAQRRARRRDTVARSVVLEFVVAMISVVLPVTRQIPLDSLHASLAQRYARAGWPGGLDDDEVMAASLLVGLVIALPVMMVLASINPIVAPAALALIITGPGLASAYLSARGSRRQQEISRTMPFVLDLLVLTMRAGASLTIAIERVAGDYARHPIGVEFRAILRDLELGSTLREALENLVSRVPIGDVRSFVDELIQAEELGRPLAEALGREASDSRTRRIQRAIDVSGQAKVKVLIPGMLILMACLIVLFAPFVVRFFHGGYTGG